MSQVIFKRGDPFFDPVAAFYASWIGYHAMHATERHDVVSGRLRGFVVPQLRFSDDPIIGILRRQDEIVRVQFDIDMADSGKPKGQSIKSAGLMEFWCQQMFGHAFETARPQIEAKYGGDRKKGWPSTLQVAYHIRNGCFHRNKFDIRANSISELVTTGWRGRPVTYANNGARVAGEFFGPADFVTLLYDSQLLLAA